MSKIEEQIADAIKNGKSLYYKKGYGCTQELYHDMVCGGTAYLIGTCYAQKSGDILKLGVYGGAYKTMTTKSRINAVAGAFGLPRIYGNHEWIWGDCVPYNGVREFII